MVEAIRLLCRVLVLRIAQEQIIVRCAACVAATEEGLCSMQIEKLLSYNCRRVSAGRVL